MSAERWIIARRRLLPSSPACLLGPFQEVLHRGTSVGVDAIEAAIFLQ